MATVRLALKFLKEERHAVPHRGRSRAHHRGSYVNSDKNARLVAPVKWLAPLQCDDVTKKSEGRPDFESGQVHLNCGRSNGPRQSASVVSELCETAD